MRIEDFQFIGIDPGNSGAKVAVMRDGKVKYYYIPNVTGPAITLHSIPKSRDEEVLSVEIQSAENWEDRKNIFVGELARQQLQENAIQDRDRYKVDSDSVNLIVPAVLGMLYDGRPIVLGIGSTPTDIVAQKPMLIYKLVRTHSIKFHFGSKAGKTIKPEVVKVYPYAQAAAGLFGIIHNHPAKESEWDNKTVLGFDFGHGQFSMAYMENLSPITRFCFSGDFGFYKVAEAVSDFLNKIHYVTATIPQLQKAVENGFYLKNNAKIDLTPIIGRACLELVKLVKDLYISKIPAVNRDQVNSIVNMGGGGETMVQFVRDKFGMKPEIFSDSLYMNALGLLCIAIEKWSEENGAR